MKQDEVPQDQLASYGEQRKAIYALDTEGRYATVASSGWEAEATVTGDAAAEFERQAAEALAAVRAGRSSPLEYHMYARRMDLITLAQSTGLWRWRIRRHLRPERFACLSDSLLARYADALGLTLQALKAVP